MNYEPLDSLPYIDEDVTDEERQNIEKLILEELSLIKLNEIHPKVKELYTLPQPHHLIADIGEEELTDPGFSLGGIDLSDYSNLENTESLQKSLVFTSLRNKSLKLSSQFVMTNLNIQMNKSNKN
ncbi:hypothetical protein WICANDRAFT_78285 [Wickerhamomyces anomalus NRRL Y-366-8]|uniref:Uncharacterized protein n=1 Tax=Wickerhamomyces anomalus (strain ATCC 58044 / CBS 1984 / NCYC 433 / NRRL Y-366-8) TaxID=683960 RepID=A0A1E3P2V5_WICAA|nr:uncharacterized protein WICANDRAFT_78285 [Wickerhamomyces anomalus NRRL Y-366-8]ODQ59648.1 hypothetical protein WICANDRAFT_78285 [Wickerhamomyces anomalus NRRL Y-366-8]